MATKCGPRELVLADRFYLRPSVTKSGEAWELAPGTRVKLDTGRGTTLGQLLMHRYVKLEGPIRVPCHPPLPPSNGPMGPLGMLDSYLRNWAGDTSQKGRRIEVPAEVEHYISDWIGYAEQRLSREEPHPITTPKKFMDYIVANFAEAAPGFGGKFDIKRFKKDVPMIVERTLKKIVETYKEYEKPVFGQHITGNNYIRLKRADELARAWLPEKSPVRRQFDRIFSAIGDREIIGP